MFDFTEKKHNIVTMRIPISDIVVKKRIRQSLGDLQTLKESLERYGQLTPITVDEHYVLIAGQRRLESAKQLGWETIEAIIIKSPGQIQSLEMEIEENTQREPFTEEELMTAYVKIDRLRNPRLFRRILNVLLPFFIWLKESVQRIFHSTNSNH